MAHAVETMMYAGEVPWHGIGVGVKEAQTSEQAIRLAGLDWDVKVGAELRGGPLGVPWEGRHAVYRESDGRVLGVSVGAKYQPIQNREAFAFLDSLVEDRVLRYETAGSLLNGEVVWALARLDGDITVAGDRHVPYMLLVNGHNTNVTFQVRPTLVRVVCHNTMVMALGQNDGVGVSIKHTQALQSKLEIARSVLQVTTAQQRRYAEWLRSAAGIKTSEAEFEQVQERLFGPLDDQTPKRREDAIRTFREIYDAEVEAVGENAYALINAVTGYADHGMAYRENKTVAERRFASLMLRDGRAAQFKTNGLALVAKAADLPALSLN